MNSKLFLLPVFVVLVLIIIPQDAYAASLILGKDTTLRCCIDIQEGEVRKLLGC
jgi:hypothetical protein